MRTVPFPQSGRAFGSGTPAGAPGLEGGPQRHRGYHDPGYSVPGVPSPCPRGLSARASAAMRSLCPGPTHTELSLRCPNLLLPPETPGACAWGLSSPVSPSFLCRHSGGAGAPRPGAFRPHVAVRGNPSSPQPSTRSVGSGFRVLTGRVGPWGRYAVCNGVSSLPSGRVPPYGGMMPSSRYRLVWRPGDRQVLGLLGLRGQQSTRLHRPTSRFSVWEIVPTKIPGATLCRTFWSPLSPKVPSIIAPWSHRAPSGPSAVPVRVDSTRAVEEPP